MKNKHKKCKNTSPGVNILNRQPPTFPDISTASGIGLFIYGAVMSTYIKLYRKFSEWEWYTNHNTKILFIHLLLIVNRFDGIWRGIPIKTGQKLTSLYKLSAETGLSLQNIRTGLKNLESTQDITIKTTKNYTMISVNNYEKYQEGNTVDNSQSTHGLTSQPTHGLTYNKKLKKVKKEKNKPYSEDCQKLIDYFLTFFHGDELELLKEKKKNESFLKTANNLLEVKKKTFEYIKTSIRKGKTIDRYRKHFKSFNRLNNLNREGDRYIDIYFMAEEFNNNFNISNQRGEIMKSDTEEESHIMETF